MAIGKFIGAIATGVIFGGAALAIDNKVRKPWQIPAHFPESLPFIGGKAVPFFGGKDFEAGWALLPAAGALAFFGAPGMAYAMAGVAGAEAPKVILQFAPSLILPPNQAQAVAGRFSVGSVKGPKLATDDVIARLQRVADKHAASATAGG